MRFSSAAPCYALLIARAAAPSGAPALRALLHDAYAPHDADMLRDVAMPRDY